MLRHLSTRGYDRARQKQRLVDFDPLRELFMSNHRVPTPGQMNQVTKRYNFGILKPCKRYENDEIARSAQNQKFFNWANPNRFPLLVISDFSNHTISSIREQLSLSLCLTTMCISLVKCTKCSRNTSFAFVTQGQARAVHRSHEVKSSTYIFLDQDSAI